ncbi:hypothetical protein CDAR_302581 [Caerostris darwini]|uniref:Uncharacterized protein n=1 Tax=Caerostris darwini TaxID=1538125 RepID=A0AAV4VE49_9ARAC|nr:hypothetical protein CDAR_302581 [Caerostris darwini]
MLVLTWKPVIHRELYVFHGIKATISYSHSGFAGVQWCAMTLANILRASTLSPQYWFYKHPQSKYITGDQIDSNIRFQTARNLAAYSIENDQYLFCTKFQSHQRLILGHIRQKDFGSLLTKNQVYMEA